MYFNLLELKKTLEDANILICFNGPFSQSIIEELGNAARRYLSQDQMESTALMDVFAVYIEQTQNIRNYARRREALGDKNPAYEMATVLIGRDGDRHIVASGNMVHADDAGALAATIDELNGLDRQALRARFKEQSRKPASNEVGRGAGLGLIDIARKTSGPIQYKIHALSEQHVFLQIIAAI
ncbi:MAG: SiaB family protein kinase [Rhodocyclaceae bacterium]